MKTRAVTSCTLVLLLLGAVTAATAGDRWLHVRVAEGGDEGDRVDVNVPLSVVASVLPLINIDELQGGMLHLDDEFEGIDLAEALSALRDSPDAEFVTVRGKDESVRVAKEDDFIHVLVEDHGRRSSDRVHVRMPLSIVDALLSGRGDRLDLMAALDALGDTEGIDLVRVDSDDAVVRVWVDSDQTGTR